MKIGYPNTKNKKQSSPLCADMTPLYQINNQGTTDLTKSEEELMGGFEVPATGEVGTDLN